MRGKKDGQKGGDKTCTPRELHFTPVSIELQFKNEPSLHEVIQFTAIPELMWPFSALGQDRRSLLPRRLGCGASGHSQSGIAIAKLEGDSGREDALGRNVTKEERIPEMR